MPDRDNRPADQCYTDGEEPRAREILTGAPVTGASGQVDGAPGDDVGRFVLPHRQPRLRNRVAGPQFGVDEPQTTRR